MTRCLPVQARFTKAWNAPSASAKSSAKIRPSPSDLAAQQGPKSGTLRLGGLVETGSVKRQADGVTVRFVVTDTVKSVAVEYRGILPDLFKEGKGVVTQGRLEADGVFRAQEVLAKHDENYMPPEAANAVERANKAHAMSRDTLRPAGSSAGMKQ